MAELDMTIKAKGLNALELYYEPVLNMEYHAVEAYRTQLRINSTDLGIILPQQYLPIAERTVQASKLSLWSLSRLLDDVSRLDARHILLDWVSFYVPIKLLVRNDFLAQISEIVSAANVEPSKICLELPGELLFENSEEISARLSSLRQMGFLIMITDYGSEFCPLLRLLSFPCDFVLLDSSITYSASCNDEKEIEFAANVVNFVKSVGAKAIAAGVDKNNAAALSNLCSMSVGKLAGKLKKSSSIRN